MFGVSLFCSEKVNAIFIRLILKPAISLHVSIIPVLTFSVFKLLIDLFC